MTEQPQPWDTAKVTEAFADARQLVEALSTDHTGDAYREALEEVLGRRLDDAKTLEELRDRLAYVIYGQTIFGVGALALAEQLGSLSRTEAVAALGKSLDAWLA